MLDFVVEIPQAVLVCFFRKVSLIPGFLCPEACLLPALPGDDRVIGGCEGFLFANRGDPPVNRLLVKKLQTIQFRTVNRHSPW
jgi:hypothetical protein